MTKFSFVFVEPKRATERSEKKEKKEGKETYLADREPQGRRPSRWFR